MIFLGATMVIKGPNNDLFELELTCPTSSIAVNWLTNLQTEEKWCVCADYEEID